MPPFLRYNVDMKNIHKAGGILIMDRKLLIARSRNKEIFMAPGGKLEEGETALESLVRELKEEFDIAILPEDAEEFGTFHADSAGDADTKIRMDVFIVKRWSGDIVPSSEIEEIKWITSADAHDLKIGSIFEHEVLPRLVEKGMID